MTHRYYMAVGASAVLCIALVVLSAQPTSQPTSDLSTNTAETNDAQIASALSRGADFLLSNFDKNQLKNLDGITNDADRAGLDALCVAALLQTGDAIGDSHLSIHDPAMKAAINQLKSLRLDAGGDPMAPLTYAHALRAVALAIQNRQEDRSTLASDVNWLIHAQRDGAYTHGDSFVPTQTTPPQYGSGVQPTPGMSPYPQMPIMTTPPTVYATVPRQAGGVAFVDHCIPRRSSAITLPGVAAGRGGPGSSVGRGVVVNRTVQAPSQSAPSPSAPTPLNPPPVSPSQSPAPVPNNPAPTGSQVTTISLTPMYPGQMYSTQTYPTQQNFGTQSGMIPPQPAQQVSPTWDNLDSAIGLLGVWAGAEAGIEVPPKYWQAAQQHWLSHELPTGQWSYDSANTQPSIGMTWAGDWALRVTQNWMNISQTTPGRQSDSPGLLQAAQWLETSDNSITLRDDQTTYVGFNLFMLDLVGQSNGYKFLGSHDWYHEIVARVLPVQWPNGAFGRTPDGYDAVLQTAYTMIFLSRGLHPVFMEKLRFDGTWSNRPRDLVNLTRFGSQELERSLNWEVVPTSHDWTDWLDSPVLYIASHEPPQLSVAEKNKLRDYVLAGGMLFTHADAGNDDFNHYVEQKLVPSLFPNYAMQDIPANDPIYSVQYLLKPPLPKLRGVSNGSRWLLVSSPVDLAANWQTRNEKSGKGSFELAVNLFVYAAGKTEPRSRLALTMIPESTSPPGNTVKIARLTYGGNWDPEPYAWTRFDHWMQRNADRKLQIDSTPVADLKPGGAMLAVLTGTSDYSPNDHEVDAIKSFVQAGGWLLIDDCGGDGKFAHCIETQWLPRLSNDKPQPLDTADPIFAGEASAPLYREGTLARVGNSYRPMSLNIGKGRIIYASIDITTGLLAANTAEILGYQPASAMSFAKNVVLSSSKTNN